MLPAAHADADMGANSYAGHYVDIGTGADYNPYTYADCLAYIHRHRDTHANGIASANRHSYLNSYTFDGRNRNLNAISVSVAYTDNNGSNAGNYTITGASSWPARERSAIDDSAAEPGL